jgi:hypothetical protein
MVAADARKSRCLVVIRWMAGWFPRMNCIRFSPLRQGVMLGVAN